MLDFLEVMEMINSYEGLQFKATRSSLARSMSTSYKRIADVCDWLDMRNLVIVHEYQHRPNVKAREYRLSEYGKQVVELFNRASIQPPLPF